MEVISLPGACQISRKDEKWQRGREATGGWTAAAANPGAAAVLKMGVGEVIKSLDKSRAETPRGINVRLVGCSKSHASQS